MMYQGLTPIMGEITTMVSNSRPPHDQHIYDYFSTTEKWMRIAVPQLFADCMENFKENLTIEFETYLNGSYINHTDITQAIEISEDDVSKCYGKVIHVVAPS